MVLRALESLTLGSRREVEAAPTAPQQPPPAESSASSTKPKPRPSRQLVSCRQSQRPSVPCDWTVKSQLEVQTEANVSWLLRPSLSPKELSGHNGAERQRLHATWQQAVKQWVYPDSALPKQLAGEQGRVLTEFYNSVNGGTYVASSELESTADTIIQRRIRWLEAVHALTAALLRKDVPYFYLLASEWTAVAIAEQEDESQHQPAIFVVGSISQFRKRLSALWGPKSTKSIVQPQGLDGLETVDDTQPPPAQLVSALTRSATLSSLDRELPGIAEAGELGVRAVLDVIVEFVMSKQPSAIRRDVPQLLSPAHFLHACSRPVHVSSAKVVSSAGMTLNGTIKPRFRIEFQDAILSTNLTQLLHCLAESTEISSEVAMPSGPMMADRPMPPPLQLADQRRIVPTAGAPGGGLNPFRVLARQDAATFTPAVTVAAKQRAVSTEAGSDDPQAAVRLEARCMTVLSSQHLPLLMHKHKTSDFGLDCEQHEEEDDEDAAGMFLTDISYRSANKSFELLFAPPTGSST